MILARVKHIIIEKYQLKKYAKVEIIPNFEKYIKKNILNVKVE